MNMKKRQVFKRIICMILSLTFILGVVGSITQREAKAASDPQKVTLTLTKVDDGGHWYFSQSGLSGNYLGGKRYRFDAVADGKATSQDRIVFYDKEVTIWSSGFQTKKPTTSYYIPAGTVLYQWDGSSDENMADGYQLVLAEDFYAECIDGVWTQTEITKDVTLELTEVDKNGDWNFSHSELTEEYQGASNGKSPVRYLVESCVDGGSTPVVDKIRFDGAKAIIYANTFTKKPTTSYYIPAGTILREWDTSTTDSPKLGGKQLRLTEDFYAVYEDGVWTQTKITPEDVTLELTEVDKNGDWNFSHSELSEEYQGASNGKSPVRYLVESYVDGGGTPVVDKIRFDGAKAIIYANTFTKKPTTSYYIPAGTILKEWDTNTTDSPKLGGKQLRLTEDFYVVNTNDTWIRTEFQTVTLELTEVDKNGDWNFSHSELTEEYQGASSGKSPVRYLVESYVDGGSTPVVDKIRFDGAKAIIYANTFTKKPTTSYYIPAGTILREWDTSTTDSPKAGGKQMKLTASFEVVYEEGAWVQKGQAEDNAEDVKLQLIQVDINGDWNFSHSELTEEYQGTSSSAMCYLVESYVDGSSTPTVDKIKFSGNTAIIYSNSFEQVPTTSYYIPAGTILKEWDTNTNDLPKTGGKQLRLTENLEIVYEEGRWVQKGQKEVVFNFSNVEESGLWILSFENEDMWGTGYYTLSSCIIDGVEVKNYVKIHFPTWTSHNPSTYTADLAYIYIERFPNKTAPKKSFMIPAGTILKNDTTGAVCKVEKQLYVEKNDAGWVMKQYNVTLGFEKSNENGDFVFSFDNTELAETGCYTVSSVLIDNVAISNVQLVFPKGSTDKAYIYKASGYPEGIYPVASLVIPKDALLTGQESGLAYSVTEELTIEKTSSGWQHIEPVYNDVKITFLYFGHVNGFSFKGEIVAGPDKGKSIDEVYGNWSSPSPTGDITYYADGRWMTNTIRWYTVSNSEFYIEGNYKGWGAEQTKLKIAANTIVTPVLDTYSQVPMRIINEVNIEKESVYGLWRQAEDIDKPITFLDVAVQATEAKGNNLILKVTTPDGEKISLSELYGRKGTNFYGAMTLCEENAEEYTNSGVFYKLSMDKLMVDSVGLVTKDYVKIEAGTVLLAHSSTNVVPLRIAKTFILTRDANDKWIVTVDENESTEQKTESMEQKESTSDISQEENDNSREATVTRNPVLASAPTLQIAPIEQKNMDYMLYIIIVSVIVVFAAMATLIIVSIHKKKNKAET